MQLRASNLSFAQRPLQEENKKTAPKGGTVVASSERYGLVLARFGDDLLSHVLRRSTIGAKALNGRVRDGIVCFALAMITKPRKNQPIQASTLSVCMLSIQSQTWLLLDQIKPIGQLVPVN